MNQETLDQLKTIEGGLAALSTQVANMITAGEAAIAAAGEEKTA